MKYAKKLTALSVILALLISVISVTSSAASEAALLNIYGDNMLFRQNSVAVIAGTAPAGSSVSVVLCNSRNEAVSTGSSIADKSGAFEVEFLSPEGSYEEYTVEVAVNSQVFRTLENVVFGELWLASGQSNMQYPLSQAKTGAEDFRNNALQSKWIRVLSVPPYPAYKGSEKLVPAKAQNDIEGAFWMTGESPSIYSVSAVGFFFAESLMEELDMPVGILNASLGGSTIRSWLSGEAIDGNEEVKGYLEATGDYISVNDWKEDEQSIYYDMTANWNGKIAPLTRFSISGMIWYQGESDLMLGNTQYDKQFDLLQKSYTDYFSYEDGLLPVIYTHIAAYNYSDDTTTVADWNRMYDEMQLTEPSSRAVTAIYDIPITYLPEVGVIHPECKEEVGDRMALCAINMLYTDSDSYTSPTVEDFEIKGESIFVKFRNTGAGLVCPDDVIKGFALSGSDLIFTAATAEIVSADTVKLTSEGIASPESFSYAYCLENGQANLYAGADGKATLPVSPFISQKSENAHYWTMPSYCDFDNEAVWHTEDDTLSGYYSSWTGKNASLSFSEAFAVSGKGMKITAASKSFSVSPLLTYKEKLTEKSFTPVDTDYSDYGTLSFYVKNTGTEDISFKGLRLYENAALWYSPAVYGTLDIEAVIPADGNFHRITLDLGRVYHLGNECSLSYDNEKLGNIRNLEFCFASSEKNSEIYIDDITFTPSSQDAGTRYDVDLSNADNPMEIFTGLVLYIFGRIASVFA